MVEIKNDYIHSLMITGFEHAERHKHLGLPDKREEFLKALLNADINRAKYSVELATTMGDIENKQFTLQAQTWQERVEEASKDLKNVDYVIVWGEGYVYRLLSDPEETKLRIYINPQADITTNNYHFEPYRRFIEQKQHLEMKQIKEADVEPFWYDLDKRLDGEKIEELQQIYGKDYVRVSDV